MNKDKRINKWTVSQIHVLDPLITWVLCLCFISLIAVNTVKLFDYSLCIASSMERFYINAISKISATVSQRKLMYAVSVTLSLMWTTLDGRYLFWWCCTTHRAGVCCLLQCPGAAPCSCWVRTPHPAYLHPGTAGRKTIQKFSSPSFCHKHWD